MAWEGAWREGVRHVEASAVRFHHEGTKGTEDSVGIPSDVSFRVWPASTGFLGGAGSRLRRPPKKKKAGTPPDAE
jgi:hypothetical protein